MNSFKLVQFVTTYIPEMLVRDDFDHAALSLAYELCKRLNKLLEHPDTADDILALISNRITPSSGTAAHPYIPSINGEVGFIGILNGALGGAARIEAVLRSPKTIVQLDVRVSDNLVLCEHANEVPAQCPCPSECYCKSHTCRPPEREEEFQR